MSGWPEVISETSLLQQTIMAFNGTWKVEKSENYEKFMEVMGKTYISFVSCENSLSCYRCWSFYVLSCYC